MVQKCKDRKLEISNLKFVSARHAQTCHGQGLGNAGLEKTRRNGVKNERMEI